MIELKFLNDYFFKSLSNSEKDNYIRTKTTEIEQSIRQFEHIHISNELGVVDLGLPSGTLWVSDIIRNENGEPLYFGFGETSGYTSGQVGTVKNFGSDYKFGEYDPSDINYGFNKYNRTDKKIALDSEDDAATSFNSNFKIPSPEEIEELKNNTTTSVTQINGVSGVLFTSNNNNNKLFVQNLGYANDGRFYDYNLLNGEIDVWSSVRTAYDCSMALTSTNERMRYEGHPILPILNYKKIEFVDLGLPSGTLWATDTIKDGNGNFLLFAWGEMEGYSWDNVGYKKNFEPIDYKFFDTNTSGMTKYNAYDGKTVLDNEDDITTLNYSGVSMATSEQFNELFNNTTAEFRTINDVNGLCFTSQNGKTLFIPAVGYGMNGGYFGGGDVVSVHTKDLFLDETYTNSTAFYYDVFQDSLDIIYCPRGIGCIVWPVKTN